MFISKGKYTRETGTRDGTERDFIPWTLLIINTLLGRFYVLCSVANIRHRI